MPFDVKTLKTTGPARPVGERVGTNTASGHGRFAVSTTGVLVYEPGEGAARDASLVWVDRKGAETPARAERTRYQFARLSPDGLLMALGIAEANGAEQILDLRPGARHPGQAHLRGLELLARVVRRRDARDVHERPG